MLIAPDGIATAPRLQRGVNGFEFATHYLTHHKLV